MRLATDPAIASSESLYFPLISGHLSRKMLESPESAVIRRDLVEFGKIPDTVFSVFHNFSRGLLAISSFLEFKSVRIIIS